MPDFSSSFSGRYHRPLFPFSLYKLFIPATISRPLRTSTSRAFPVPFIFLLGSSAGCHPAFGWADEQMSSCFLIITHACVRYIEWAAHLLICSMPVLLYFYSHWFLLYLFHGRSNHEYALLQPSYFGTLLSWEAYRGGWAASVSWCCLWSPVCRRSRRWSTFWGDRTIFRICRSSIPKIFSKNT